MKYTPSLNRVAFLALALSVASFTVALAQDTPPASDSSAPAAAPAAKKAKGGKSKAPSTLTDAEKDQLMKAHDAALAANPDLQKEADALKAAGAGAAQADKDAHKAKMRAAMLKIDPTLQPIFDKQDAAMKAKAAAAAGGAAPAPAGN